MQEHVKDEVVGLVNGEGNDEEQPPEERGKHHSEMVKRNLIIREIIIWLLLLSGKVRLAEILQILRRLLPGRAPAPPAALRRAFLSAAIAPGAQRVRHHAEIFELLIRELVRSLVFRHQILLWRQWAGARLPLKKPIEKEAQRLINPYLADASLLRQIRPQEPEAVLPLSVLLPIRQRLRNHDA